MWAVSAGAIAYCSKKSRQQLDDRKVPLMGVLGAFLFAAQMINFTIPATGSSGHLGGGLLLAILLGPSAAFLTIASVLMVQALFFADGGLLALGCNLFNLGVVPAFLVYPLIYKPLVGTEPSQRRLTTVTMIAAIVGLQLGALGVVLETLFSGIAELPFSAFLLLMQPIHLAIGIVEGVVTVAVVSFVQKARPEILLSALEVRPVGSGPLRNVILAFLVVAIVTGGMVSWFASDNPDGLEWSIARVTGMEELKGPKTAIHGAVAVLQEKTALLPDYSFKGGAAAENSRLGTTASGLLGGVLTLGGIVLFGVLLRKSAVSRVEH
jgi:cobalt/nickel transport system permease protein